MRNERLKSLLKKIDLEKCTPIIDNHIYYIKTPVKQRCSCIGGGYRYITTTNEFLLIAENGVKQAIILRCDESDLHWYVLKPWRKKHVLSNALRTGVVKKLWPENTTITCCYDYDDDLDPDDKKRMTKHLAEIAGLQLVESKW